jgi:hypothetical protein
MIFYLEIRIFGCFFDPDLVFLPPHPRLKLFIQPNKSVANLYDIFSADLLP